MRALFTSVFCLVLCSANASAQALATGRATSWDVSLGYAYADHPVSQTERTGLNGVNGTVTVGLSSRVAIRGDLGYMRSSDLLGTPSHADLLTYLAGPVFYPTKQGRVGTDVHFLLGGARVSGPIPVSGGILIGGYATGFAWAAGGGVNYQVSNFMAIRAGLDYLRTGYYGSSLTIQGQNNLRATAAVVYSFGSPRRRRRL